MSKSLVRTDAIGLFVKTGGYVFRPGATRGYEHAFRMDDAGIQPGDKVKARHLGGSPLAKLTLDNGTVTRWAEEYTAAKDHVMAPADAIWLPDGRRDTSTASASATAAIYPREIFAVSGADLLEALG